MLYSSLTFLVLSSLPLPTLSFHVVPMVRAGHEDSHNKHAY